MKNKEMAEWDWLMLFATDFIQAYTLQIAREDFSHNRIRSHKELNAEVKLRSKISKFIPKDSQRIIGFYRREMKRLNANA